MQQLSEELGYFLIVGLEVIATIVALGGKMGYAMEIILAPIIDQMMNVR